MSKQIFITIGFILIISGCSKQSFIRPSDVLVDKAALIGTSGNVGGYAACSDDYCNVYENKNGLGIIDGSSVTFTIDKLPREDKKFLLTTCKVGNPCHLVVSGKYIKNSIRSIVIEATAIEKIGMTKILHSI